MIVWVKAVKKELVAGQTNTFGVEDAIAISVIKYHKTSKWYLKESETTHESFSTWNQNTTINNFEFLKCNLLLSNKIPFKLFETFCLSMPTFLFKSILKFFNQTSEITIHSKLKVLKSWTWRLSRKLISKRWILNRAQY